MRHNTRTSAKNLVNSFGTTLTCGIPHSINSAVVIKIHNIFILAILMKNTKILKRTHCF